MMRIAIAADHGQEPETPHDRSPVQTRWCSSA